MTQRHIGTVVRKRLSAEPRLRAAQGANGPLATGALGFDPTVATPPAPPDLSPDGRYVARLLLRGGHR